MNDNARQAEGKIRELAEELDAERRKSMMDENKARELEKQLNEKIYFFNELTRRKSEDER